MNPDLFATLIFYGYYLALVCIAALISNFTSTHQEVIRKIYHTFFSCSVLIVLYFFHTWWIGLLVYISFFGLVYLGFSALYRTRLFQSLKVMRNEKSEEEREELRRHILSILLVFSGLIVVFWGLMGYENRHHIAVATVVWGVGDAAAAVFGRIFGKRKFNHRAIDRNKTLEGFISFFVFAAVINTLFLMGIFWTFSLWFLGISILLALVGGVLELVSKKGWDNVVLPPVIAVLSWIMLSAINTGIMR